jgi:UDP-N-acetyl-D-mannosaminuronate dehydrogenase
LNFIEEYNNSTIYNIYDSIIEYRVQAESLLEKISVKVIENSYRSVVDKKKELNERLRVIRNSV